MTKEEIISGLKFTVDMFLFDPFTGESFTEPRNDMDKTTIDACRGAIELLEKEPFINKPCVAHQICHEDKIKVLNKIRSEIEQLDGKYVIGDYATFGEHSPKYVRSMKVMQIIDKYKSEREE